MTRLTCVNQRLSFIISSICLESCHVALGFYEVVKAKKLSDYHHQGQEGWATAVELITFILQFLFRCDLKLIGTSSSPGPTASCLM